MKVAEIIIQNNNLRMEETSVGFLGKIYNHDLERYDFSLNKIPDPLSTDEKSSSINDELPF